MRGDRRFIETQLPLADIDEEAAKEKMGRSPIFQLLFWWTRKPLVVSRTAVLASLVPKSYDLKDFKTNLGLSSGKRAFLHSPNRDRLAKIYREYLRSDTPRILDPMAGGGSIPFEALRIGADVVVIEYNPVAFIILKATLEIPRIYGPRLFEDIKRWGKEVLRRAENEIGQLYPKHRGREVSAYIWCWTVNCVRCGQQNPLIMRGSKGSPTERMWISPKDRLGLRPVLLDDKRLKFEFTDNPAPGTITKGKLTCLRCGSPITNERVREEIQKRKRKLLSVVIPTKKGNRYEPPTKLDLSAYEQAVETLKSRWQEFHNKDLIPYEEMPFYELNRVTRYGFSRWHELFSERQLLAILTLAKHIFAVSKEIEQLRGKDYARAIATYLALTLCQHARFNARCTLWQRTRAIVHVFAFRRPGMTWDHAEVNPFSSKGSGTWTGLLEQVVEAAKFADEHLANTGEVEIRLGSCLDLPLEESSVDLVVTDPPYLDDVPYGELSEFYHVWLWRILHSYYPELPGPKVPVDEELDHSPGRHGSAALSREFYMKGLMESFREMRRVLAEDGLLVLFFAHSKRQAWSILISSLVNSGFHVTMTWPVRTESPTNIIQRGKASMQSSILVAARKRMNGGTAFLEDLRDEVADHVRKGLEAISDLNLIGADLIVAGMGKALEVTTRYSELKSYSGNATLESMLEVVSEAVFSYSIEKLVRRSLAALDPQTAFYIFVKCSYGGIIPPDDALMICKAAGVELQALQYDKTIDKKKIGTRTILTTLNAYERNLDLEKPPRTPSILDQLHLLELAVNKYGKRGFDRLVSSATFRAGDVRAVAEGLYNGLLLIKKDDPEIELLRPIIDLYKTGAPTPPQKTIDKYLTGSQ